MGIGILPPEILRLILLKVVREDSGKPSATASRHLLAVCFQWRDLVTTAPEFWTNVSIVFKGNRHNLITSPTPNPDQVLARLDLQLQRSGSQLIDVYCDIDVDSERARSLFGLILRRAPFCRWRTLDIFAIHWVHYTLPATREDDKFVNLEYLKVHWRCEPELFSLLDRTTTSKLKVFQGDMAFQRVREHCPNILSKISELHLGTASDEPFSPPPNVVKLTLPDFQLRELSHALHLTLTEPQIIGALLNFDWTHLVFLDIATAIYSYLPNPVPAISFPRLKTLIIRGSLYTPLSRFSAPQLTDLRFDRAHRSMKKASKGLDDFLSYVFFSLSPSEVIEILFPLSKRTLTSLIRVFSQTKRLKLHFEDEYDGYETIRSVFCNWDNPGNITVKDKPEAASSRSTMLTEHLDLQLKWKYREGMRENWTARMVKVLEDTRDTRLNKIKCTWKGELPLEIDRSPSSTGDDVLEKGP